MKDVLARRRAVLGDDNPLVARTMVNIATLLSAAGKLEQSQAAFEEAIPKFEKAYGSAHPDNVHLMYAFGVLRYKQHQYADAERLLRRALASQEKIYPADHAVLSDTRYDLGNTLLELGRLDEAQALLQRAYAGMVKAYGADAPDTRDAAAALEKVARLRGK